jgi:hypothetical protein
MDTTTTSTTREPEYPKLASTLGRTPSPEDRHHDHAVPKDWKFWCIIFSLALSVLLTAVEFVSPSLSSRPEGGSWDDIYIYIYIYI